jgi:hypothetical protein
MRSKPSHDDIGDQIRPQLRAIYEEVLREPLPDRFCALLDRLEADGASIATPAPLAKRGRRLELA